jgi:hypothetical protein
MFFFLAGVVQLLVFWVLTLCRAACFVGLEELTVFVILVQVDASAS